MTDTVQTHCTRPWYIRPPVWILGVFLVALAVFAATEMINRSAAIPYGDFLDQLDAGNVARVTFNGTRIDGAFKHPLGQTSANGPAPQTSFRSQVPDFGDPALLPELRKQHVAIDVVSSWNWTHSLAGLPWPMALMIAAVLIAALVRLIRGDKAFTGSTMSMHPMMGFIGGLFRRQDQ